MAINWTKIAGKIDGGLQKFGGTANPAGYPITLRKTTVTGGDPWTPGSGTATTSDTTMTAVETLRQVRDVTGTVVERTVRTLIVSATSGVVPDDNDTIALGVRAEDVGGGTAFVAIEEVRAISPAGIAVAYEIDLVS